MSQTPFAASARNSTLWRLLGAGLFALAFALPSVRVSQDSRWNSLSGPQGNSAVVPQTGSNVRQPLTLRGVHCAAMSLLTNLVVVRSSDQERRTMPWWMYLVACSAWINPMMLFYLLASLSPKLFKLRCALAGAIFLCLIGTVIFFAATPSLPLIGYFTWITGILIICGADAANVARNLRTASAPV